MRVTLHVITLRVNGVVHKAFRSSESKPLDEVRKYVVLGTSYEDALDRVRQAVMPHLDTTYESLVTEWGSDGERGDFVELARAQVFQLHGYGEK